MTAERAAAAGPWACSAWARRVTIPDGTVAGRTVRGATAKAVLLLLASYARPNGTGARPGVERIAGELAVDERTVRAALRRLVELGLILPVQHRYGGRGNATVYRLIMGPIALGDGSDSPEVTHPDDTPADPRKGGHGAPLSSAQKGGMVARKGGHGAPPSLPTEDKTPTAAGARARARTRGPSSSAARFPKELDELRSRLWRVNIRPTWNLDDGQARELVEHVERCGPAAIVAAAYAAGHGREPLAWWTGLLPVARGAMPPPTAPADGTTSPADPPAGATPPPDPARLRAIFAEGRAAAQAERTRA